MNKKIFKYATIFLGTSILLNPSIVNAATAKINISANTKNVKIGQTVKITYKISSSTPLGAWDYQLTTPSNFSLEGCNNDWLAHQIGHVNNNNTKSASVTCTFKATKNGNGTFSVKNYEVDGFDEQTMGTTVNSTTVIVGNSSNSKKEETTSKEYSSNNNLKSLSIEGYKLDPTFKSSTTTYSVDLESDIEKIKIKAAKEDSKASISGDGEVKVSEGNNKIEIKVTAENGDVKTYTINANVKEKDPIKVKIGSNEFILIRKKDDLKAPNSTYKDTTVNIENEEIPALQSDITQYILVGLKDEDGNFNLYIYNEKDKSYTLYKELTFKSVVLYVIDDTSKIPKDLKKEEIEINKEKITAYKLNESFYLLYGMNIETGETTLYQYDSKENTLQRYINNNKEQKSQKNYYLYGIIGLGLLLVITYLGILINLIKRKPNNITTTKKEETNY